MSNITKQIEHLNELIKAGAVVKVEGEEEEIERFSYEGGDFFHAHYDEERGYFFFAGDKHKLTIEVGRI